MAVGRMDQSRLGLRARRGMQNEWQMHVLVSDIRGGRPVDLFSMWSWFGFRCSAQFVVLR